MNKILKIFLALVLTLSMMLEIIPVNTVHADEEVPVSETETTEPAEETESEETEEPVVPVETETEEDPPAEPAEIVDPAEPETPAEEETVLPEDEPLVLNEDAFSGEYTVGDLKVAVSYETGTVPEGTEVFVSEASEEALNAIKEQYGEDADFLAADISFVFEDEEIEPRDYSDKKVSVILSYDGEESPAETIHLKEIVGEDGEVEYNFQTVAAVITPVTETIQVPVYEKQEITEKRNVPYEYKWTETVKKYKEVDVYGDVEVEYEEEVPVYETREITEERTEYVTKTRQVEKTRTVKVKVDFVWWNPLTWLGYKYVTEKYYVTETYEEPVTVTVVVGTEEVQVGTEVVTKTRTERQVIGKETVEDGTEEVVHTETRYREEEVGIGQYELVVTGYNEETVTLSQTVSFETDDFSTFLVRWGYNNSNNVTIHHGIMVSGRFVEFGSEELPTTTSNTNYPTNLNWSNYDDDDHAILIYDFAGYEYYETRYLTSANTNPTTGTSIWPALQKRNDYSYYNNNWRYCLSTRSSWNRDGAVANGSHIYVIYREKTVTDGSSGSGGGGDQPGPTPSDFKPDVGKNVSNQQDDGTYEIELGFVGNKDTSEVKTTARVIVVFDLSGSMEENMSGGTASYTNPSRLSLAKDAVNALAETLLDLEDSQGNKLVEMGLVTFATDARIRTFGTSAVQFTSDYDTYSGVITNLPISSSDDIGTGINQIGRGTNWEKGLDLANSMQTSSSGKTYVVFVSDGDPTYRVSRGNYSDSVVEDEMRNFNRVVLPIFGYGSGSDTITRCYSTARESAKSIVDHNKTLYTVGLSSDATNMRNLATYSGGTYKAGDNAEEFAASLADIAGAITSEIGLTDVVIDDGVTDMSQIETDALIGTTGNFEYYQSYPLAANDDGYTYKIGETTYNITQAQVDAGTDGTHRIFTRRNSDGQNVIYIEYPWNNAPEASVTATNNVIWNTHDANDSLEDGVYYSVKFTVWPKQEAYDLIADLDNKIRKITDTDLADGTKEQLRVLLNGTTYEYDSTSKTWTGGLTDAQLQSLIDTAGTASYSMKTNTGLSASYKYGGSEGSATYTNYTNGNMTLDVETFGVKKLWNNVLPQDTRSAKMLTNEQGYLVNKEGELILDENDQPIHYRDAKAKNYAVLYVELIVTKNEDGQEKEYEDVTVYSSDNWELDDIFISLGVLSVSEDGTITVRETGHEYSVKEKPADAYYWELETSIYRPMMVNKDVTMMERVVEGDADYEAASQVPANKSQTINDIIYYNFEGAVYRAIPGHDAIMTATNHRRSYLNLTKEVNEKDAPENALFEYEITITIPGVKHSDEAGFNVNIDPVWFSVFADGAPVMDLEVSDNVTAEVYDGQPTGYFWVDSGETFTVKMQKGWNYRSSNLLTGTTYKITEKESSMDPGFVFEKVEPTAISWNVVDGSYVEYDVDYEADKVTGSTIEGTILDTNTAYTVTYTNKYLGVFYVYHSSDKTVERFPMAVNGVPYSTDNTFNVYALAKENTLYGGYYSDYLGKSEGYNSSELEFDENNKSIDADGTAYSYQYIKDSNRGAWSDSKVYTTSGKAMVPVQNETYFLKEVPQNYMLPYTHYTYYKEGLKLANLYTITAIDDLNYDKAGFIVRTDSLDAIIVDSLSIKAKNSTATTTLTPEKVFKAKSVVAGYLGYFDITEYKGNDIEIVQFWKTYDGIDVFGTTKRTLTFENESITGLKKKDEPYKPGND